ncbi:MAG: 16S rRNA (cytosine(1402)-N(4))-methyltransferase RsmH [Patescibacteria group bacterium]
MSHIPVLVSEVVEGLALTQTSHVIDCTLGDGGHALAMLERAATLLGIDADPAAIASAHQRLKRFGNRAMLVHDSFRNLQTIADAHQFRPIHAILFDLGWSMPQVKERGRGFSFMQDEPLDMRFDPTQGETAAELINRSTVDELARILRLYGEEPRARAIAEALYRARPVARTTDAVRAIETVYDKRRGRIHPATLTFQALRIAVNDELGALKDALPQAVNMLEPNGRLAVITFHSLEDRIVKQFFKGEKRIRIITKKPIVARVEEVTQNPAARSAKLRIAEKL